MKVKTISTNITREACHQWTVSKALVEVIANHKDSNCNGSILHDNNITTITTLIKERLPLSVFTCGYSTARGDDSKIGMHGIGLVDAVGVLLREGCTVSIQNMGELITPSFMRDEVTGQELLVFHIETGEITDTGYVVEVRHKPGQGKEEFDKAVGRVLEYVRIPSNQRSIVETGSIKVEVFSHEGGHLWIKGIQVADIDTHYSINILSGVEKVGRDREHADAAEVEYVLEAVVKQMMKDDTLNIHEVLHDDLLKESVKIHGGVCKDLEAAGTLGYSALIPFRLYLKTRYDHKHAYSSNGLLKTAAKLGINTKQCIKVTEKLMDHIPYDARCRLSQLIHNNRYEYNLEGIDGLPYEWPELWSPLITQFNQALFNVLLNRRHLEDDDGVPVPHTPVVYPTVQLVRFQLDTVMANSEAGCLRVSHLAGIHDAVSHMAEHWAEYWYSWESENYEEYPTDWLTTSERKSILFAEMLVPSSPIT